MLYKVIVKFYNVKYKAQRLHLALFTCQLMTIIKKIVAMHIDEDREEFDLSDHNLLVAEFNINTSSCKQYSDNYYIKIYHNQDK